MGGVASHAADGNFRYRRLPVGARFRLIGNFPFPNGYVNDQAGKLTPDVRDSLEGLLPARRAVKPTRQPNRDVAHVQPLRFC